MFATMFEYFIHIYILFIVMVHFILSSVANFRANSSERVRKEVTNMTKCNFIKLCCLFSYCAVGCKCSHIYFVYHVLQEKDKQKTMSSVSQITIYLPPALSGRAAGAVLSDGHS